MSDNENLPAPSKQTSSVPLKKETVRVTLKAADAPAAPTAAGAAPVVRPPTPTMPPSAGAPTAPRAPGSAPAPTVPLRPAGPPTGPTRSGPAPTIPLRSAGAPTLPGSVALPKATVQLQSPTQPLTTARPALAPVGAVEEEEAKVPEKGSTKALAVVALVAALVLLGFQLMIANSWISNTPDQSWGRLFSSASDS